jgi:hypothetical protein
MADRFTEESIHKGLSRKINRRQAIKEGIIGAAAIGSVLGVPAAKKMLEGASKENDNIPFVPLEELMANPQKFSVGYPYKTEGYLQYDYTNIDAGQTFRAKFHLKPHLDFISDRNNYKLQEKEGVKYVEVSYIPYGSGQSVTQEQIWTLPEMREYQGKVQIIGGVLWSHATGEYQFVSEGLNSIHVINPFEE